VGNISTGKSGKLYPAYRCAHRGHYYHIPKQELEDTVAACVCNLTVSAEWHLRNQSELQELQGIEDRITEHKADARDTVAKIRVLSSPTAIKFMEEDFMRIEQQLEALATEKNLKQAEKPGDIAPIMAPVKYFLTHLDKLIVQ
jgi:hypothetical protein